MIAQLQNLQAFVANHLADVVDWGKHVRPDPNHKTTGDHGYIVVKTPFNSYEMTVRSAYIEPPAGAPVTCRSLGTVTFDDAAGDKHIVGPKADNTWLDISRHIHVRELTDALAAARREVAEAPKESVGSVRVRLAEIAGRAKVWGIKVRDDDLAMPAAVPTIIVTAETAAVLEQALADPAPGAITRIPPGTIIHVDRVFEQFAASTPIGAPFLGCPVVFITNPGEQISGMQEIPGTCVKIISDDRISMFMTPDHSEPSYRDNLPRRGSVDRDGKVHRHNCWDFNPEFERERARVRHLEEAIARMTDDGNADRELIAALTARIDALEEAATKPRRARPPKADEAQSGTEEPAKEPDLVG